MERKTHELVQGSIEWHQFRATHFGASEASAMLGISPYKSRTELLREKKTGIAQDVDAATQRIFDRGHEIEALARPMAEAFIREDLYPVTMSYGKLSASCDGLTFDESIAWECKSSNKADLETVRNGELPEKHWPQCQQVMLVTGAEKLLFTISDGTEDGTAHVWVNADAELQQRIVAGWEQFEKDLEAYEPEPEVIPARAEPVMALPALLIQVGGSISIQSNLDRFGERLKSFIEETNAKPETDQDFVNLEQACKVLKDAEDALKQAESNALAQTASVDEMRRTVAYLADMARNNRLTFEKLVKSEKENRKAAIVSEAKREFGEHFHKIELDLPVPFNYYMPNFADAVKGKKTLSSMQDAVNTMLANAKIEADALARELREKHAWYVEAAGEYAFLFSDLSGLIYKDSDAFKALVQNRITERKERERIEAEQKAREQKEREERIAAEAAEKARQEEQERIAKEVEQAAAFVQDVATEIAEEKFADLTIKSMPTFPESIQAAKEKRESAIRYTRAGLIHAVAFKYGVTPEEAEQWLVAEFGAVREAA